jgi:TonB family protein
VDRIRTAIPVHPGANDLAFRIAELAPRAMPQAPLRPDTPAPTVTEEQAAEAEPERRAPNTRVPVDPTLVPHQGFTTALAQNRLLTPVDASAKHFLGLLTSIAPDQELTKQARALLFAELTSRAEQATSALDSEAASTWIDEAALLDVDGTAVAALRQTLHDRMIEAESTRRVPASALKVVEYVPPVYPARALDRALHGWVDLEFTVDRDGATKDVEVVDASHSNYFREEASRAVSAWRFEPRVYMEQTIEQRAHTRIRFTLQ